MHSCAANVCTGNMHCTHLQTRSAVTAAQLDVDREKSFPARRMSSNKAAFHLCTSPVGSSSRLGPFIPCALNLMHPGSRRGASDVALTNLLPDRGVTGCRLATSSPPQDRVPGSRLSHALLPMTAQKGHLDTAFALGNCYEDSFRLQWRLFVRSSHGGNELSLGPGWIASPSRRS